MSEAKQKKEKEDDPRLEFVRNYILKSHRLKIDRWQKLMGNDEYKNIIYGWLNTPTIRQLIITNNAGNLSASFNAPATQKQKLSYFARTSEIELTVENIRDNIIVGDMSPNPIEDLAIIVDHVYYPLLMNPNNQQGWTDNIRKDVESHLQELRNTVSEIRGNIINQTLLPMPIIIDKVMQVQADIAMGNIDAVDMQMKNVLEGIIIKWATQIDAVLKENSSVLFENNNQPMPLDEINFWQNRWKNLENIYNQLRDPRVKAIGNILEKIKSVYFTAFSQAFKNVVSALFEARDISLWLKPLEKYFDSFETVDFFDLRDSIHQMLHCVCLMWANSRYYCKNSCMVILFKTIHNMIIASATRVLDPEGLFQGEPYEILATVEKVIDMLECYKFTYNEYKNKLQNYQLPETNPIYWTFRPKDIFERFDLFLVRLQDVREILITADDFMKLERVEVGGLKGRIISRKVQEIFDEFRDKVYNGWHAIKFNPLDVNPKSKHFEREKRAFIEKTDVLELKLAVQFKQAFDECSNLDQLIKLVHVLGTLLARPLIAKQVGEKLLSLMYLFNEDLDIVKQCYDKGIGMYEKYGLKSIPFDDAYPPVAGTLMWVHKLSTRIERPVSDIEMLEYPIFENDQGRYILQRKDEMIDLLQKFEEKIFSDWSNNVPDLIATGMNEHLICRNTNRKLHMNFVTDLSNALTEVKYLKNMNKEGIPDKALQLFELSNSLWSTKLFLTRVVEWYNEILSETNPVEFKIIENELQSIDRILEKALMEYTWEEYDLQYIQNLFDAVKGFHERVMRSKNNVKTLQDTIQKFGKVPLYERKDDKINTLIAIDDRETRLGKRKSNCQEVQKLIEKVMDENFRLLFNYPLKLEKDETMESVEDAEETKEVIDEQEDTFITKNKRVSMKETENNGSLKIEQESQVGPSLTSFPSQKENYAIEKTENETALYRPYEEYIDNIVGDEIMNAINTSVKYIKLEMENRLGHDAPIFEVNMDLQIDTVVYLPALDYAYKEFSLQGLIEELLIDIYSMSDDITRVAPEQLQSDENLYPQTYVVRLRGEKEIERMKQDITGNTRQTCQEALEYFKIYDKYSYLYLDDKKLFLERFLKYGRPLTTEEIEKLDSPECTLREEKEITLDKFKAQIDFYDQLYDEVMNIESSHTFNTWLLVNVKPFRAALLNQIGHWNYLFKNHLANQVRDKLQQLEDFIVNTNKVFELAPGLKNEDFPALLKILESLNQIRKQEVQTDNMFEPLKEIVSLLSDYNLEFEEKIHDQFAELPELWMRLKKAGLAIRQDIAPIQEYQVDLIQKRISLFNFRMQIYREKFKKLAIFSVPCHDAYEVIDKTREELDHKQLQYKNLVNSANLFELNRPEEKQIQICDRELKLSKQIWDFVYAVESCIDDWKTTPWKRVNVEDLELECKKFGKELRLLDKDIRAWEPYTYVTDSITNLMASLKAITSLQNPAIRDRHWAELMRTTKVRFSMDAKTTLKDLLDLNLHKFEEEVKNIVDKSIKEEVMEKAIKNLVTTWKSVDFNYDIHERTQLKMLKISEENSETLTDHLAQLQTLLASKYIAYFFNQIQDWQDKLTNADQVLESFTEVQRKWMYLESIFIGSEDIRNQLPDDSKRFTNIDHEFKTIVNQMSTDMNIVKATNRPGLYNKLEDLMKQLTYCEKAINEYLETKRLAYPRFYFISSADLLDILANGNHPELVARHLTKLYDSLAKLLFTSIGSKTAKGMISKENDEYVEFEGICDCSGKVENWLNRVTDIMRITLHKLFDLSVKAYVEKERDQWLFDWPAQPALCATQIWWSIEVNRAFDKMEEGYDKAMKEYLDKHIRQLKALIVLLIGELTPGDRQKIMTICTIDVHARDVVSKMIEQKIEASTAFQWQSQLRHRWDDTQNDCFANICDAQFKYDYEYLGNTPRLVITPLTDRCYITLTQSLHLIMGGAPAGPAGTGKTETTKDLGRALGIMVYVFNCSEQMDYKSCGNIYKGLSQTGAWGCFDEFNRISVEVLSVVAVQVKCIQDAIKAKKKIFNFMGEQIDLIPTVGIFITMNPGYAGRTELPENLKALFRPCAMVVPDFELIAEIMLVAEGFQEARMLARKFITLYTLCRELLSKQDHYDWGLRAIKSVLVVAGSLKRADKPETPEENVLMRALRDFNIPKIVTEDVPVFLGLIGDLFPNIEAKRQPDVEFEKLIAKSAVELKLQAEKGFILKVVQLQELFEVRHSVFIIGNAGTGKTQVWKTLHQTYHNQKGTLKPHYDDLDPKAVTNDELFGIINPATREWKDGLFSVIMRNQANMTGRGWKWIVLDGDIDPMWIESLNTVMDDNKVLTLASNERIALTKQMRLLFEISNLRTATPATVSRAGILYINPADLGWNPYVASWIETRESKVEKGILPVLFEKYIVQLLENGHRFKKITPITEIAQLQMTVFLLECLLTPENVPSGCPKEWYEIYFVFSVIWGFGSALFQDQIIDWRNEFHKWWTNEFKTIKFPSGGNIFNFYIDPETKQFLPWSNLVSTYELDIDTPLQQTLVPTTDTTKIRWFMDKLIEQKHPVMLIGTAGSGKSVLVQDKLNALSDKYAVANVPFNFYTTSEMLQKILEKPLEKTGRQFGPPKNKFLIYFVDDMNMPEVDAYGTVQPHTLIRQFMDYKHWYDRNKLTLKEIKDCQFISCMNPTAGSFTIDPRLQRHFCTFAVNFPGGESLFHIYNSILSQQLASTPIPPLKPFSISTQKSCTQVVHAAVALHYRVAQAFLPTSTKFHYTFNLKDLSNIFQCMLFIGGDTIPDGNELIKLWMHEATRVYSDKLISVEDMETFNKILVEVVKKNFDGMDENKVFAKPLLYWHYADGLSDSKYMPVKDSEVLTRVMITAQQNYNDEVGNLNLVLFEDAVGHVCRINRILESPRGNALLIGVGGSGKQSLSRLSAYISNLDVFQIQLRKGYGINDLKADIAGVYVKTGVKNIGIVFLMTDAQVSEEHFLVVINDMLASGEISELFADDEVDNIINNVRNEVKQLGIMDTKENCWKFFIDRVRRNLKVVLCFSPVGSTLRVRGRKFPAIINCTSIDWFHEWPKNALESVSENFLEEIIVLPRELVKPISMYMSYVHGTVNEMSKVYYKNEKRYNYTTPKSFLELIALYSKLINEKSEELKQRILRLENGVQKLHECGIAADSLKEQLALEQIELNEKNAQADILITKVKAENDKVQAEKSIAGEKEREVKIIEEDVSARAKGCEEDLLKAQPALRAAEAALDVVKKKDIDEMKKIAAPVPVVQLIIDAVHVYLDKQPVPKDRSWKSCQLMMSQDQFLNNLKTFEKKKIPPQTAKEVKRLLADPLFNVDAAGKASQALKGLCEWVQNIDKFYDVYLDVEPKERALEAARLELADAQGKLHELQTKIQELEDKAAVIKAEFDAAKSEKDKCQAKADHTAMVIDLANRLVNGLSSEGVRWRDSIDHLKKQEVTLPGDVLLVCCFLSYVGCFTRRYRIELQEKMWIPTFKTTKPSIPYNDQIDPLSLIADEATIASWNNEGLPNDRMSSENATILINSSRWPLMIDPQLQGIKWIKQKYGDKLKVLRTTGKYIEEIEKAVSSGDILLLENIDETLDAVLDPLLGRQLIKKGTVLKMGDHEIDFNPNFKLILQTKLANPHYKPEMQAQTTLINFTVTRDGLEEQLLGEVVKVERPDLEQQRSFLTQQQNEFKIMLKRLEDDLLSRLATAGENIVEDVPLVESLEKTKSTAASISKQVEEAKITAIEIDSARENYRSTAERASILYFVLSDLHKINPIYQFSLKAFTVVFKKAILSTPPSETLQERVNHLIDSITFAVFMYTSRALFEKDKLIFMAQMAIQILLQAKEISQSELQFLLRFPYTPNLTSPLDFLTNIGWGGIKSLSLMDEFKNLDKDIESSAKRWKKFVEAETPEREKFPGEWKNKSALQRLCIMRCLRPDRMTYAVRTFIEEKLGTKYVEARTIDFSKSYEESSSSTPIFFVLSPGVDPLKEVEALGKKLGFTSDRRNFHNVSLGQGQEVVAEYAIDVAAANGAWVILQNVHLVAKWLPTLEKKMEAATETADSNYRLFISAEPAQSAEYHIIPQGILESAIKITNEPPSGMLANVHKALDNFNQDTLEKCSKETEFKAILFALCYFHAVVAERRKFGPQGWNRIYPFNNGDLTISVDVLYNYLEANNKIPWEDLRYLFGEIMYGGHITDDWDRRLCRTYLEEFMQPDLVDGELFFCPGFMAPPNIDYNGYHHYIDENLPQESPTLYYLHPNAEIGFLTTVSEQLFKTIFELQPRDTSSGSGVSISREDIVKGLIEDFMDKVPEEFNIGDLNARVEDKTPFMIVAIQEADRMNILMREVRRSLRELNLGLKGELTITPDMEVLEEKLFFDHVPETWTKRAYPSMLGLQSWFSDLQLRLRELENWTSDFNLPSTVWLGGFFNPQSFLTAIMQETARKRGLALDNMRLSCDVTRKFKEEFTSPPREGAYITGLYMEGARWDMDNGTITSSRLKDMFPEMPVIFIKAITQDKVETKGIYNCPVYRTKMRGPTYVWTFDLKSKERAAKWTLGGVCLLLQV